MIAPVAVEPALAAALARVAAELKSVAEALAKVESLLQFIASAAEAK